jgi:hypothetical protein
MDEQAFSAQPPNPLAGRAPAPQTARVIKNKPDPGPMRLALGAAGLAFFSALTAAIVLPPRPAVLTPPDAAQAGSSTTGSGSAGSGTAGGASTAVQQPVQYVQLQPGQTAPPGAKVIDQAAPQPVTVITTVPAPAQKPITVKTTQSGKVIP